MKLRPWVRLVLTWAAVLLVSGLLGPLVVLGGLHLILAAILGGIS